MAGCEQPVVAAGPAQQAERRVLVVGRPLEAQPAHRRLGGRALLLPVRWRRGPAPAWRWEDLGRRSNDRSAGRCPSVAARRRAPRATRQHRRDRPAGGAAARPRARPQAARCAALVGPDEGEQPVRRRAKASRERRIDAAPFADVDGRCGRWRPMPFGMKLQRRVRIANECAAEVVGEAIHVEMIPALAPSSNSAERHGKTTGKSEDPAKSAFAPADLVGLRGPVQPDGEVVGSRDFGQRVSDDRPLRQRMQRKAGGQVRRRPRTDHRMEAAGGAAGRHRRTVADRRASSSGDARPRLEAIPSRP